MIPRPHALAPALAPASSLAALVAAQLEEKEREAGGKEKPVGASDVRLSLSRDFGGAKGAEGDEEALFAAGSSATIADVAAAVLERKKKKKGAGRGISDALGPLKVWYSVAGV